MANRGATFVGVIKWSGCSLDTVSTALDKKKHPVGEAPESKIGKTLAAKLWENVIDEITIVANKHLGTFGINFQLTNQDIRSPKTNLVLVPKEFRMFFAIPYSDINMFFC